MLFQDYLIRYKQNNNFPHALIVQNNHCCNLKDLAKQYLKSLICEENLFCNKCHHCQRINQDCYVDFIFIDNNDESIKKNDVANIQRMFIGDSFERSGIKLYVIKNIERASLTVLNTFLKFVEDPPNDTYALFFTANEHAIISTIHSRCHTIRIDDQMSLDAIQLLKIENPAIIQTCIDIFKDSEEIADFVKNYDLQLLFKLSNNLIIAKNQVEQLLVAKTLKKLSRYEIFIFIKILIQNFQNEKRILLLKINNFYKLNLNKNLVILMIMDLIN